jgi:hypothetical protein
MTEENPPEGAAPSDEVTSEQTPSQPAQRGSMRFQDENTTAKQPSVGEQRARRQAFIEQEEREEAERQAAEVAKRKSEFKRKVLIGGGVTVGLVGLVATYYGVAQPKEVTASCTDANGVVVADDNNCDEAYVTSHNGYSSGGFLFLPIGGGGYNSYRYNYGGTGAVGQRVAGGSYTAPSNANVTSKTSGKSVQRGGLGISGKSGSTGGTGGTGKSGGS